MALREALNWALIRPKNVNPSDSGCISFQFVRKTSNLTRQQLWCVVVLSSLSLLFIDVLFVDVPSPLRDDTKTKINLKIDTFEAESLHILVSYRLDTRSFN